MPQGVAKTELRFWRSRIATDNTTYPAKVCPFYGDVAAIWSMLIRSILHKRGADFKSFLVVLRAYLQNLDNPGRCGVLSSKTTRTKRRNEACSATMGG